MKYLLCELNAENYTMPTFTIFNTKEEAIIKCSANGNRERRMVLTRPITKQVGEGDNKTTVVQMFDEKYDEEDLILDYLFTNDSDDEAPFDVDEESNASNDMDWLKAL